MTSHTRREFLFTTSSALAASALASAKVLFIIGHSEYWTREAMQRVREFLDRGGAVVCLSGNTMYWRVSQSDDGGILECRKADAWGAQLADYMRG
ncbi:MAG TPA: N,N-dimethylformamidase beta subunit family domain-containing protein [Pirellulales bacterium]|nr:N,N-dimethylformamidase beta subunit family domain-containing protein [Pirellulales bacterium]